MDKEKYYFDKEEADNFIKFMEKLHLPKGVKGQLVVLLAYQIKIATELLATKKVSDGSRRYREAFITMARKNAKSFIAAAIMLYLFFTDDEQGQENIIVANSVRQASNIYNMINHMVKNNPTLMRHCKIVDSRRTIERPNGSFIQVMAADPAGLDGFNPYVATVDETHEDKTHGQSFTKISTGMGARRQPLILTVTTASDGQDEHNLEFEKYNYALKVQKGEIKDDAFYSAIYRADDDCELLDEEQWIKANPGIDLLPGGFRKSDELKRLALQAKAFPVKEADFRRYYLNQHVILQTEQAINMDYWNDKKVVVKTQEQRDMLLGRECYAGLDLSINKDFTAFVLIFPVYDEEIKDYLFYILPFLFKPLETLEVDGKTDKIPYLSYVNKGDMIATEGDFVNFRYVRHIINDLSMQYDIKEIAYDKFSSGGIASDLQNDGFDLVDHIQRFGMSPTISDFYEILYEKRFRHFNNGIFNWMAKSTKAIENTTGKLAFDKTAGKIDGIISMIMALTLAVKSTKEEKYDPNKAFEDWYDEFE